MTDKRNPTPEDVETEAQIRALYLENVLPSPDDAVAYYAAVDKLDAYLRVRDVARALSKRPVSDGRLVRGLPDMPRGTPVDDVVAALVARLDRIDAGEYERVPRIIDRDGLSVGLVKNPNARPCPMHGCAGVRMHVIWPAGSTTYPCTKGCQRLDDYLWKIM